MQASIQFIRDTRAKARDFPCATFCFCCLNPKKRLQKETDTEVSVPYRWAFKPLLPTVPTIGIPDMVGIV